MERLADVLCHLFHLGGEGIGNAFDPFHEIREGHLAYLVEGDSPEKWFPGPLAQSGSVAAGAGTALEEPLHPLHPFLVLDFGEGVLYGINCVVVGEVHLPCVTGFLVVIEQVLLLGRSVEDYPPLLLGEVLERDVGTYSHIPCDILHQGPHEGLPRGNGTFVDGLVLVGDQGGLVHFLNHAGTVAFPACAGAVESKFLCARGRDLGTAYGASDFEHAREVDARFQVVAVGAAVVGEPGEHEPDAVEQLRGGTERTPDPGHPGTLVERQSGGHIADVVDLGTRCLGHASAGVGGKGFQITSGTFRIEGAEGEGGFPRTGYSGDSHDLVERYVDIDILEVVDSCTANLDMVRGLHGKRLLWILCCLICPSEVMEPISWIR